MGNYEGVYCLLRERNPEAANRWRVAKLAAEWALSDGDCEGYEKWDSRADRIEHEIVASA